MTSKPHPGNPTAGTPRANYRENKLVSSNPIVHPAPHAAPRRPIILVSAVATFAALASASGYWVAERDGGGATVPKSVAIQQPASQPYLESVAPQPRVVDIYLAANDEQIALAHAVPVPQDPSVLSYYRLIDSNLARQALDQEVALLVSEGYAVRVVDLR